MEISKIGEAALIEHLSSRLKSSPQVIRGIGDDAAVMPSPGNYHMLFTTDMMVEEVHFSLSFGDLYHAGKKCITVNVSDIAAMGGSPTYGVISAGFPEHLKLKEVEELYKGINDKAAEYGLYIVGGDTVKSRCIVLNIALLGIVKPGKAVYRSGALEGDYVFLTGSLGKSAAGLYVCTHPGKQYSAGSAEYARGHFLDPVARVAAGSRLGQAGIINSLNDISDGLATEIHEITKASHKGCRLYLEKIPIDEKVREIAKTAGQLPLDWALYGGEDFELVFTARPEHREKIENIFREIELPVTVIGEILPVEEGVYGTGAGGAKKDITPGGYQHFSY